MPIPILHKTVHVTLRMQELLYDIDNITWRRGTVLDEASPEQTAALRTHLTDENTTHDQILRSIDGAIGNLLSLLGEYLASTMSEGSNVAIDGSKNISLTLRVPQNYDDTSLKGFTSACHNYIVEYVAGEWYDQVKPDESALHRKKSDKYLTDVISAINNRRRPSQPT